MTATEERNRMLAESNRKLLDELHDAKQKLAFADRAIAMLETCCGDWQEARATIMAWRVL